VSDKDEEEIISPMAPVRPDIDPDVDLDTWEPLPKNVTQTPSGLERDIQDVLNRHSAENPSGTPDFILAAFLQNCLYAFNQAVVARAAWRSESVELPALISLHGTEVEVPLVTYSGGQRNEIGTAKLLVSPGEALVEGKILVGAEAMFKENPEEDVTTTRTPEQPRPATRFERYQREGFDQGDRR
jgi:hypothetical protein